MISAAFSFFGGLLRNDVVPTIDMYDDLLEGYAGFGPHAPTRPAATAAATRDEIDEEDIDEEDEEDESDSRLVYKGEPNVLRLEQVEQAIESLSLAPSARTYDILFRAYVRAGSLPQTSNAFHTLRETLKGTIPPSPTAAATREGIEEKDIEEEEEEDESDSRLFYKGEPNVLRLEQVEQAIESLSLAPSARTYDILFRAYVRAGSLPQTSNAFHKLRETLKGTIPMEYYEYVATDHHIDRKSVV